MIEGLRLFIEVLRHHSLTKFVTPSQPGTVISVLRSLLARITHLALNLIPNFARGCKYINFFDPVSSTQTRMPQSLSPHSCPNAKFQRQHAAANQI